MGIFISPETLVIRSWYRNYSIRSEDIDSVSPVVYMASGAIGWLPIVGSIRVVEIGEKNGRTRYFPSTVGRRKTVLRNIRTVRSYFRAGEGLPGVMD